VELGGVVFLKEVLITLGVAFGIAIGLGSVFIPVLKRLKFGQSVRSDGPQRHLTKSGTPTMGGLIFLAAILIATILRSEVEPVVWVALVIAMAHGIVGFADDYLKVALRRPLGLKARSKLLAQLILGLALAFGAVALGGRTTTIALPFGLGETQLGWFFYPFTILLMMFISNAVNLTDGLDGLAGGLAALSALSLAGAAWLAGQTGLGLLAIAVVGGCLGFLYYNKYPARVFMGDTGSLALGAALGAIAVLMEREIILLVAGGVFVVEALSVILQVLFFRLTGKRIFRMSPLHHHFELVGWRETKVVRVFWMWGLALAVAGLWVAQTM